MRVLASVCLQHEPRGFVNTPPSGSGVLTYPAPRIPPKTRAKPDSAPLGMEPHAAHTCLGLNTAPRAAPGQKRSKYRVTENAKTTKRTHFAATPYPPLRYAEMPPPHPLSLDRTLVVRIVH